MLSESSAVVGLQAQELDENVTEQLVAGNTSDFILQVSISDLCYKWESNDIFSCGLCYLKRRPNISLSPTPSFLNN